MRRAARVALTVIVAAALSGCGGSEEAELVQLADFKWGDGEVQHSTELMSERLPALAAMEAVTYYIGGMGKVEWVTNRLTIPGPTDYWVDGVVTMPDGFVAELLDTVDDEQRATEAPDVVSVLVPALPDGDLWWSETLNGEVTGSAWHGDAYLSPSTDQIVLVIYEW